MFRARFWVDHEQPNPVVWPIPHPYWCTGYTTKAVTQEVPATWELTDPRQMAHMTVQEKTRPVIVAYVDSEEQLKQQWPEAQDIDMGEEVSGYIFTDRFPKPQWFTK